MKKLKTVLKIFAGVFILACIFIIYITFVERNLLIVKNKTINFNAVNNIDSVKIAQFTDTHLGEFYSLEQLEKAVLKINKQNADIVFFTGDLFDIASQFEDKDKVSAVLKKINAPLGKFAIYGNRDYGGGAVRIYTNIMQEAGFEVLTDDSAQIQINSKTISIYGADDYLLGNPDVSKLMAGIDENDFNILLTHEPDTVENYAEYPIDMAFSGHSHGGQVYLPLYGAVIKTNLCDTYFKGMYQLDNQRNTQLFVSTGIGNTKVPFRFLNIPEIAMFNLNF